MDFNFVKLIWDKKHELDTDFIVHLNERLQKINTEWMNLKMFKEAFAW